MRLLLLLLSTAAFAGERAFVQTVTARDTYYVNEPIVVRLRVGIEAEFLKANVVQMFQTRLDFPVQVRAPWLKELAGTGCRRLAILCPSFVADCLETLEEIGIRARESWRELGGEELLLVPSLNDHPAWIDALARMIRERA